MQDSETTGPAWPKPAVAWFGVAVLFIAFIFSIADRIIIALLDTADAAAAPASNAAFCRIVMRSFGNEFTNLMIRIPVHRMTDRCRINIRVSGDHIPPSSNMTDMLPAKFPGSSNNDAQVHHHRYLSFNRHFPSPLL